MILAARWVKQDNYIAHLIETDNTLIYRDGVYEDFAEVHLKKVLFDAAEPIETADGTSLLSKGTINEVLARVCSWSLQPLVRLSVINTYTMYQMESLTWIHTNSCRTLLIGC